MRSIDLILRRSNAVLAVWVALAAAAAPGLLELGYDNSPEVFFVRDSRALAGYRDFVETFGDFGAVRIAASGPALWSAGGLAWLAQIERQAPTLAGVYAAAGPWGARSSPAAAWPPADPLAFRDQLLASTLAREAGWVSPDGEVATVLLALRRLTTAERRDLLLRLEQFLAERPPELDARVTGLAVIDRALDRELSAILSRLFPLVVALGVVAIAIGLRSATDTALPLLLAASCETIVFGAMGYAGVALNVVTSILPLLLFVVALATGVHLLIEAREQARTGLDARQAVVATWRRKGWPVLWTVATTGVGFGSLAWSRSPPVRTLGSWAALGIGVLAVAAFTFYPALLARARRPETTPRPTGFERRARRLGGRLADLAIERRGATHAVFGLLLVAALAGVPRLRLESDLLGYLPPTHPARTAIEELEAHGVASVSAELLLRAPPHAFERPQAMRKLAELSAGIRRLPDVLGAVGAADLPADDRPFSRRARALTLADDGAAARVSVFVPFFDQVRLARLAAAIEAMAAEVFPRSRVAVTGHFPMVLAAQRQLLATVGLSLGVTLAAVAGLLAALAGGGRLVWVALAPNLWPVAMVLGAMGWLAVPLDAATVMTAAVILGIAVDDTLHYLGGLRARRGRSGPAAAARSTLRQLAPAHLLTSLVLIFGFALLAASGFVPVARFGALAAGGVAAALAADLLWVPALTAAVPRLGPAEPAEGVTRSES